MKKHLFTLVCCAAVLLILVGAAVKHTVLSELRVPLIFNYSLRYTVVVRDVPEVTADMYTVGMGLFLDAETSAGTVKKVTAAPAQSGMAGCQDLTLTVSATASAESERSASVTQLTENNELAFQSRFIDFTGEITEIAVIE